jgi:hypothetical protein
MSRPHDDGIRGDQSRIGSEQRTIALRFPRSAAPDVQWRAIIALARYGGLRTPSETLLLRWSDINWERGRMLVRSIKTEHQEGKASRITPLFPGETDGASHLTRSALDCRNSAPLGPAHASRDHWDLRATTQKNPVQRWVVRGQNAWRLISQLPRQDFSDGGNHGVFSNENKSTTESTTSAVIVGKCIRNHLDDAELAELLRLLHALSSPRNSADSNRPGN